MGAGPMAAREAFMLFMLSPPRLSNVLREKEKLIESQLREITALKSSVHTKERWVRVRQKNGHMALYTSGILL